jgi:hypothetical protein
MSGLAAFKFFIMSFAERPSSNRVPKVRLPRLSSFGDKAPQLVSNMLTTIINENMGSLVIANSYWFASYLASP